MDDYCDVSSGPSTAKFVEFWDQFGEHSWDKGIIKADKT